MATTTRNNLSVKALQSTMATFKKHSPLALIEWELACNTNNQRGHVYNQTEIINLYGRSTWGAGCENGASKVCHTRNHNGEKFTFIVIKRAHSHCWIDEHAKNPDTKQTGNQLIDEINCWLEYAETENADLLCPIMRYFTSKSDKVNATSKKMLENVIIISQKADFVGDAATCCRKAEQLNAKDNRAAESADQRLLKMRTFSRKNGWRDALHNPGNCGVIFDYNTKCYKAVFIDYAL